LPAAISARSAATTFGSSSARTSAWYRRQYSSGPTLLYHGPGASLRYMRKPAGCPRGVPSEIPIRKMSIR
jgi:hypothetical protein